MPAQWTTEDVARDEQGRAPAPTWSDTTAADLLSEERREASDAIMALVTERDRYRAALELISRQGEASSLIAVRALGRE